MAESKPSDVEVGVTEFKARCLGYIDQVASGKAGRIVLTRRNRPVAAIVPITRARPASPFGMMKGLVTFVPGIDLTEPIDVEWDALRD